MWWLTARAVGSGGVDGVLDDYVLTGQAALDAWEATGEMRYFEAGLALGEAAIRRFYDEEKGGFFDTAMTIGGDKTGSVARAAQAPAGCAHAGG